MAGMSRESAFMPSIKCSSCGNQVEISMMGDHVCGPSAPPAEPNPPPPAPDLLGGAFSSLRTNVFDKLTRAAPPSVDTNAANRTSSRADQITPISASTGSQAISPKTPNRPGLGPNGEDPFAPAIADSPPPAQNRRPGGYGGLGDPEGPPEEKGPPSLLTRMNSIAPGPFEMGRRPSATSNINAVPQNSNGGGAVLGRPESPFDGAQRPSTASSNSGGGAMPPPRMPRKNGYGGFGPPSQQRSGSYGDDLGPPMPEPLNMSKRSDTFPKPRPSMMDEAPARTPSAPGPRPQHDRMRSASTNLSAEDAAIPRPRGGSDRVRGPSLSIRDTSRPPPPRKSLIRPQTRDGAAPSINLADEFGVSNPYHSPSVSQSSSNSGYSQRSQHSSQPSQTSSSTSPARSVDRDRQRRPSSGAGAKLDQRTSDLESPTEALNRAGPPAPQQQGSRVTPSPPRNQGPRSHSDARRAPPPEALRLDPAVQGGYGPSAGSPPLRSPMLPGRKDPAVQGGQASRSPRSPMFPNRRDPAVQEPRQSQHQDQNQNQGQNPNPTLPPLPPPAEPGTRQSQHSRQPSRPTTSRGSCRACGQGITGKSISSADGRLTGRYHKACFVCTTCQKPFAGTTFYVLGDRPYCEHDYHALNGSLCGSCNRGIEGQYLEDEAARKHHVGCFRCRDCGVVLRDGYFDVGGESFCERDAFRRISQQQQQQQQQQMQQMQQGPFPPRGPPSGMMHGPPGMMGPPRPQSRGNPGGPGMGLPSGPGPLNRPFGVPRGQRLMPGQALGRGALGPIPRMEKRMTRLGMMGPPVA